MPDPDVIDHKAGGLLNEFSGITFPAGYVADTTAKRAPARKVKVSLCDAILLP